MIRTLVADGAVARAAPSALTATIPICTALRSRFDYRARFIASSPDRGAAARKTRQTSGKQFWTRRTRGGNRGNAAAAPTTPHERRKGRSDITITAADANMLQRYRRLGDRHRRPGASPMRLQSAPTFRDASLPSVRRRPGAEPGVSRSRTTRPPGLRCRHPAAVRTFESVHPGASEGGVRSHHRFPEPLSCHGASRESALADVSIRDPRPNRDRRTFSR